MLFPGAFITTIDLHKAYTQVAIDRRSFPFLRFWWGTELWQFQVLPFGLSTAPFAFQRLSTWVATLLRQRGIRTAVYLDDWTFAHRSPTSAGRASATTLALLNQLGLEVSPKSDLLPSQVKVVLGLRFDTVLNTVGLPSDKVRAFRQILKELLQQNQWTLLTCQQICGKLNFASQVVPLGMLHLRHLQRQIGPLRRSSVPLLLTAECISDLQWWRSNMHQASQLFRPPPSHFVATDASDWGYGAAINGATISGEWSARQRRWSINRRELFTVLHVLSEWGNRWHDTTVLLQTDNTTVVSVLNHQGTTKSVVLLELTARILQQAHDNNIVLSVYHLPGRFNLLPDALSRNYQHMPEWHLLPSAAQRLWRRFGKPTIDLFASHRSRQVTRYVSFNNTDNAAEWIDAFSRPWTGETAWVFPPPTLIPELLRHLQTAQGQFYLLLPQWDAAWWIHEVRQLAENDGQTIDASSIIDLATGSPPPQVDEIQLTLWTCSLPVNRATTFTR